MAAKVLIDILERIRATSGCRVAAADGLPVVASEYDLPAEVLDFYSECGGVTLFRQSDYRIDIVGPREFESANEKLLGVGKSGDISDSWFIVARCGSRSDVLTIDLDPARCGRCYFSFPDVHAVAGSSAIVAESLTELLYRIVENNGEYWYWLKADFESLGDAYD